jgi:hypothetical protein
VTLPDDIRAACAQVARRARRVRVDETALAGYAASLPPAAPPALDPEAHVLSGTREQVAGFVLCLDAINFGSGWWPTIRKRSGRSGYFTMAISLKEHFELVGPWRAGELAGLTAPELAGVLGQDPEHELMALYARALRELGTRIDEEYGGRFLGLVEAAGGSAVTLVETLAAWPTFHDVSPYDGLRVPLCKRAQLAAADLHHAGVARLAHLDRLTLFSDNLVPHVLRLDGVLRYDEALAARIDRGELLEHDSPEEVEIRACALHAVELLAAASGRTAQELDYLLWNRGRGGRYKAVPRHRSRTTAY